MSKAFMAHRESDTAGVPHVILDFVVDVLIRDRKPLALEASRFLGRNFRNREYGCLEAMCLVHRTWTSIARRGLWRRAVVDFGVPDSIPPDSLRRRLRELAITISWPDNVQRNFLARIIRQAPNLEVLYVDISGQTDDFITFLRKLGSRSHLKRIWMKGELSYYLNDICLAASRLKNLKSLVLECLDENKAQPCSLHAFDSPPESLESLAISGRIELAYIDWLSKPRKTFTIRDLAVTLDQSSLSSSRARIEGCLPFLKSLQATITARAEDHAADTQAFLLNALLSRAKNLQRLTLTFRDMVFITSLGLPTALSELHIDPASPQDDENIASIVADSRLPSLQCHLKKLVISCKEKRGRKAGEPAEPSLKFLRTTAVCRDMNIVLSICRYREHVPWSEVARNAAFGG
ncbi:hypothetical protein DFH11DRAFT_1611944 [Phellopilus nigrolimitatus]|nr:hypothetical protein DFH11DRAFT_1611944 [Phellopilus nigrolimitatus]